MQRQSKLIHQQLYFYTWNKVDYKLYSLEHSSTPFFKLMRHLYIIIPQRRPHIINYADI